MQNDDFFNSKWLGLIAKFLKQFLIENIETIKIAVVYVSKEKGGKTMSIILKKNNLFKKKLIKFLYLESFENQLEHKILPLNEEHG